MQCQTNYQLQKFLPFTFTNIRPTYVTINNSLDKKLPRNENSGHA